MPLVQAAIDSGGHRFTHPHAALANRRTRAIYFDVAHSRCTMRYSLFLTEVY